MIISYSNVKKRQIISHIFCVIVLQYSSKNKRDRLQTRYHVKLIPVRCASDMNKTKTRSLPIFNDAMYNATTVYPLYIVCLTYLSVKRYEIYQDLPS